MIDPDQVNRIRRRLKKALIEIYEDETGYSPTMTNNQGEYGKESAHFNIDVRLRDPGNLGIAMDVNVVDNAAP